MAEKRFYLYINNGMGSFTEEAEKRGVALKPTLPPFQTSTMTIAVGDYDKDGWLDFYTTEWLPHLDQSFDYNNASHSNCKLLRNLGAQGTYVSKYLNPSKRFHRRVTPLGCPANP